MPRPDVHIVQVFDRRPDLERVHSMAGRNNLLPRLPERYLYLRCFGTRVTGGKWHCDLFFTPLATLDELGTCLTDAVNWCSWLGEGWSFGDTHA